MLLKKLLILILLKNINVYLLKFIKSYNDINLTNLGVTKKNILKSAVQSTNY